MNKALLLILSAFAVSGCVTRKVAVIPAAKSISPISEVAIHNLDCEMIDTYTLEDAHPNNVTPVLKNQTHMSGGNRYRIAEVLDTSRGRPSSVVAEIYSCGTTTYNTKPAGIVSLLPGAHEVKPIAFAEIENSTCKVIGSHIVEETNPEGLYTELANEVFMRGGNRYHITNIIASDGAKPTSVSADIYRCKHQSVAF
ncbi:DUF1471 domain-containing protein [Vibrio sp. TRT 1302]|uniref:DUF1471 domain-containing protein n=1 Tax=Vibrio sp. TRT 1302 TaxID=3418504 RepID=UPI003CF0E015